MIWHSVITDFRPVKVSPVGRRSSFKPFRRSSPTMLCNFPILRASRQICLEAYRELNNLTLCFRLNAAEFDVGTANPRRREPIWHVKGVPNFTFGDVKKDTFIRLKGIRIEILAPNRGSIASYLEQLYVITRYLITIFKGLSIGHHVTGYNGGPHHKRPVCVPEITIAFVNRDDSKWFRHNMISLFPLLAWTQGRDGRIPDISFGGFEWCLEMMTSLKNVKAVTVELPDGVTVDEGFRDYVESRREVDGRKDWLFKLADGKRETVPNEVASEERSLSQIRLLREKLRTGLLQFIKRK